MSYLNLTFLSEYSSEESTYIEILDDIGKEICNYASGYFDHQVEVTQSNGEVDNISLYIKAIEIPYEINIITISISNVSSIKIIFRPLIGQYKTMSVNVLSGTKFIRERVIEFIKSEEASQSFMIIIQKIDLKRKADDIV